MSPIESTGLPGLDILTDGLYRGDNVVWRVDDLADYRLFCHALAAEALRPSVREDGQATNDRPRPALVYFRFAQHAPLFPEGWSDEAAATPRAPGSVPGTASGPVRDQAPHPAVEVVELPLDRGFELFITTVHREVVARGENAVLFFDSLSDLSQRYYSDRMIGNFFQLTCPLILRTGSVAYFSLERFFHSFHTVQPITETTQLLMDVFRHNEEVYVQPVKLDGRDQTPTFTLFRWASDESFEAVTASAEIVPVLNTRPWPGLRSASYRMIGVWDRAFLDAESRLREVEAGRAPRALAQDHKDELLRLVISREERILELARLNLSLADVVGVWKRMVGTGHIGGKSVGMLLANAILTRAGGHWKDVLERHDSFFVGSDVYYTYLVINDCWWDRQRRKDPDHALGDNAAVRQRMRNGRFPAYILDRFSDMLDYFGTSPIIVRSSSLLEDAFGNAFAGKYESVFCTMQGSPEERLTEFLEAVRVIYASTISNEALAYRKKRGILDQDEQMALLVQRVSGDRHRSGAMGGRWFFPHLGGVAFSYNPWAWHRSIDPRAGLARIVFGLGTRAVDRADDDYTRVVALNAPERRPDAAPADVRRHSQRRIDLLDLDEERLRSVYFVDLLKDEIPLPLSLLAERDRELAARHDVDSRLAWTLTFDGLLSRTAFVADLREMLLRLREVYASEVDIEFTVNILDGPENEPADPGRHRPYRINVVQCRPLQVYGNERDSVVLPEAPAEETVLTCGTVIGHSRRLAVARVILVRPAAFAALSEQERYGLATAIRGITTSRIGSSSLGATVLIGPGRWGTSTPALGVPVQVADIGRASVLVELDRIHDSLITDLSLGTHFFNEMVEEDLLYLACREGQSSDHFTQEMVEKLPNVLAAESSGAGGAEGGPGGEGGAPESAGHDPPDAAALSRWASVIHVADLDAHPWTLVASSTEQRAILVAPQ